MIAAGLKVGFNEGVMSVAVVGLSSMGGSSNVVVFRTGDGSKLGSALAE